MGNCCRTPKPMKPPLPRGTNVHIVPEVLTISLAPQKLKGRIQVSGQTSISAVVVPQQMPKSLLPVSVVSEQELTETIPSPNSNSSEHARRVRSAHNEEEEPPSAPIDYFEDESSKESLILTPFSAPPPKPAKHPLVPLLNLAALRPAKQTLNVEQVKEKRNKWTREKQKGGVLLDIAKPLSSSSTHNRPSTSERNNSPQVEEAKDPFPKPKDLLEVARKSIRSSQSLQSTPKPKPRILLPKIPFFNHPAISSHRTEEFSRSGMTTFDEKSKCIESPPITMSQISGNILIQPHTYLKPLIDTRSPGTFQTLHLRLHARHRSLSMFKNSTKFPSSRSTLATNSCQERVTPVKMTTKMIKTRKADGTIEVNDYILIREVGSGAFGKVYEARKGEQSFAVKEYNKQKLKHVLIGKRKTALDSVKEEVAILSRIEHPSIVFLHEVIDSPDSRKTYLIMEYAARGRLQDCIPLKEDQARVYFAQMVDAVEYLHEVVRVIHRDIKPDNILLDADGNIKISDFGSSQTMLNPDDTFTNTPGTPAFLSPEQCGGTREFMGKPLDIWALGVTLYYMLYNRPPFVARRLGDLYESIKSESITVSGEISAELRDLLFRLLEKNPSQRIQIAELKEHPWLTKLSSQTQEDENKS